MKQIRKKIVNFIRVLIWTVLAMIAVPFFLISASEGTPALVASDTDVSSFPAMKFANDRLYKGTVVEVLDNASSSKRYRLVRSYYKLQGYCHSSAIIDFSEVSYNDIDSNHIVVINTERKPSLEDNTTSCDKFVDTCRDLVSFSRKNPFSGVYLIVSPNTDWVFYADYFEQLHIPYGYIVDTDKYGSLIKSSQAFASEVSGTSVYEDYNILPLVFDISSMRVTQYSINSLENSMGSDIVLKNDNETLEDHDYWNSKGTTEEFASSKEFAKNVKIEETKNQNDQLEYIELNTESYSAYEFISTRSTLMDK